MEQNLLYWCTDNDRPVATSNDSRFLAMMVIDYLVIIALFHFCSALLMPPLA